MLSKSLFVKGTQHAPCCWFTVLLTYISAMTGSIGALNLLDGLHLLRQPDARNKMMPVCLSAENAPLNVCLSSTALVSELVSASSAVFWVLSTAGDRPALGSFRLISCFGSWIRSDLEREGRRMEEARPPVFLPSAVHPPRTSRAAVRKQSVWLCSFSGGCESRGPGVVHLVPWPGVPGSGLQLPSISLLSPLLNLVWGTEAPVNHMYRIRSDWPDYIKISPH